MIPTTTVTLPTKVYEALCRVALCAVGYSVGGPDDTIASDLRDLALKHGSKEDDTAFGYAADLLDAVQEWSDYANAIGEDIPDPDYDGPDEVESGPITSPELEQRKDADR